MTREEILAAAGYPNTPDGIAAFYNEYDTPEKFFAKHGGSLSGAPHNGQPTADQFFDYGSHANDKLNIPMSNPFYLEEGGAYYGGPTRPFAYGGDITEYCWGGGLPGGPNEMPEMLHGGYHSPMNYGSFPATEWGGALDPSNMDSYPMMKNGGSNLANIIKAASKSMKKKGGKTTIQGGNQNFLENRRAAFDEAIKNNIYNAFIQEEEKAAMQAMNPYAPQDMQEEDQEYTEARYGLSTYRKKGEKKPKDDDKLIDYRNAYADLLPVGRDYSQYIPANIQSQYMMSNADYARMADLNKRVQSGAFNITNFEGTPEWGPMARLLGKTGRKMFGPKSVTYKFTGRGVKQVPVKDTDLYLKDFEKDQQMSYTPGTVSDEDLPEMDGARTRRFRVSPKETNIQLNTPRREYEMPEMPGAKIHYSDQYIQTGPSPYNFNPEPSQTATREELLRKVQDFNKQFNPQYNPEFNPQNVYENYMRTKQGFGQKKYGGGLHTYQGGGLTEEQYDDLMRLYKEAEEASKSGTKNDATLRFQQKFHQYEPTKQIAQGLLKEREKAKDPTAYGRTLSKKDRYSLTSNEDSYFGKTTSRYLAELEKLKPQPQLSATPAPVTGTYPKLEDINEPDTGMDLNFKSSTPVPAMTPIQSSLNTNFTGDIAQSKPIPQSISSTDSIPNQLPFEMTPRPGKLDTGQSSAEIKPAKKLEYKEGPEETYESKIKRKTKGIGKAFGQYAPGLANKWASILEQQDPADPMQNHPVSLGNRGDYDINSGEFRPHLKVPVQFPGGYGAYRMEYGGIPKALSGLEVKMQPGLYGTNGNRQFSLPTQIDSQKYAQQPTEVRNSLTAVPRDQANLEAEGGETALVNIDGIPAHFKISGKRHSQGGVPLDLPDNSFIYSDTASMKIKDPNILAQFGMAPKKGGYTPAEIAKKYDINKYRKILSDPNSEALERKTAEAMIANNNMKLAKLSMAQESIKGFPQGIPVVAMPYMMANNIDPTMYMPTQGQEEQPDEDMGVQRYGGNIVAQYPTMRYGGDLPKAQDGKDLQALKKRKESLEHEIAKTKDLETHNKVLKKLDHLRTQINYQINDYEKGINAYENAINSVADNEDKLNYNNQIISISEKLNKLKALQKKLHTPGYQPKIDDYSVVSSDRSLKPFFVYNKIPGGSFPEEIQKQMQAYTIGMPWEDVIRAPQYTKHKTNSPVTALLEKGLDPQFFKSEEGKKYLNEQWYGKNKYPKMPTPIPGGKRIFEEEPVVEESVTEEPAAEEQTKKTVTKDIEVKKKPEGKTKTKSSVGMAEAKYSGVKYGDKKLDEYETE